LLANLAPVFYGHYSETSLVKRSRFEVFDQLAVARFEDAQG
jgi:hypothetical protein